MRAGVQTGRTQIFDFYREALGTIAQLGLPAYARQVSRPYLAVVRGHFDPARTTHTERLVGRVSGGRGR